MYYVEGEVFSQTERSKLPDLACTFVDSLDANCLESSTRPSAKVALPAAEAKALIRISRKGCCLMSGLAGGLGLPLSNRYEHREQTFGEGPSHTYSVRRGPKGCSDRPEFKWQKTARKALRPAVALSKRMLAGLTAT
jgi:hypothetical protein